MCRPRKESPLLTADGRLFDVALLLGRSLSASCPRDRFRRCIHFLSHYYEVVVVVDETSEKMSDLPFDTNDPAVRDFLTMTRFGSGLPKVFEHPY